MKALLVLLLFAQLVSLALGYSSKFPAEWKSAGCYEVKSFSLAFWNHCKDGFYRKNWAFCDVKPLLCKSDFCCPNGY
ncbi:hypothetical protein QR680_007105 [Steinernema hermaphroditum]|uniref:Uncharacterized protein n=1 Tax=Steinernema hermaphroditum TaxID=289476 RepID=A0AA39HXQ6_9BILA|nr:hypothetical protein QR680_007105 [Steinernema hermaphroditum]